MIDEEYEFHPEAAIDLEDIWEFIADDNAAAADRVVADILDTIEGLAPFPHLRLPPPRSDHASLTVYE